MKNRKSLNKKRLLKKHKRATLTMSSFLSSASMTSTFFDQSKFRIMIINFLTFEFSFAHASFVKNVAVRRYQFQIFRHLRNQYWRFDCSLLCHAKIANLFANVDSQMKINFRIKNFAFSDRILFFHSRFAIRFNLSCVKVFDVRRLIFLIFQICDDKKRRKVLNNFDKINKILFMMKFFDFSMRSFFEIITMFHVQSKLIRAYN